MIPTQTRRSYCCIAALAFVLSAPAAVAQLAYSQQKSTATNDAAAQSQSLVNVNTADAKTLATLPGVGPATAQHIIDGRPYHKLADLEKVKGLSATKVEALKGKVSFGQPKAHHQKTTETTQGQESASSSSSSSTAKHTASTPTGNAPTESVASSASSASHAASAKLAPGEKININTASAEELDRLPGIGKTKAQAIVDYRNQNGSFKSLEDIEKVKGIKAGSFEKMKDYIKLSD